MSSVWVFLKEVARRPTEVGAIVPSGPKLAERVVVEADLHDRQVIVELGAGTGSITKAIRVAAPGAALLALEPGAEMAAVLRREFPDVEVSERFAYELPDALRDWGHRAADRVVSGLPWTLWPQHVQEANLQGIVRALRPDGRFLTYTYVTAQVSPAAIKTRELFRTYFRHVRKSKITWNNVPPAFMFVCDGPRHELLPENQPS